MKILKHILLLTVLGLFLVSCQEEERGPEDNPYPSAINLTATPWNGEVTLSWEMPDGAEPTDFFVYYDNNKGVTTTVRSDGAMTYVVSGLTNDFEYTFYVQALYYHLMADPVSVTVTPTLEAGDRPEDTPEDEED